MAMNIPAPVQILRATQAEIAERTGANGELNWAEDTHELYIHDGMTKGGHLIAGDGGGSTGVTAGDGITVTDGTVAVDDTVVRTNTGNIYVDGTNGNDSNHGISVDKPVKTLQKAINIRRTIATDMLVRINFKTAGTYIFDPSQWPDKMLFIGATDNKSDTVIQIASCVLRDIYFEAHNLTVEFTGSTSTYTSNVVCEPLRCGLYFVNVTVKDSTTFNNPYALFRVSDNSHFFTKNFTIESQRSYVSLFVINYCSNFAPSNTPLVMQITGAVTTAVFNVLGGSNCRLPDTGISNSGTLTGPRYRVATGGVIDSAGLGENAIPGTQPGVVADDASFYI